MGFVGVGSGPAARPHCSEEADNDLEKNDMFTSVIYCCRAWPLKQADGLARLPLRSKQTAQSLHHQPPSVASHQLPMKSHSGGRGKLPVATALIPEWRLTAQSC